MLLGAERFQMTEGTKKHAANKQCSIRMKNKET